MSGHIGKCVGMYNDLTVLRVSSKRKQPSNIIEAEKHELQYWYAGLKSGIREL